MEDIAFGEPVRHGAAHGGVARKDGGIRVRGIDEEEARAMIVRGFVEPIAKELPLEYALEMNNLVNIELEGTMG